MQPSFEIADVCDVKSQMCGTKRHLTVPWVVCTAASLCTGAACKGCCVCWIVHPIVEPVVPYVAARCMSCFVFACLPTDLCAMDAKVNHPGAFQMCSC